MKLAFVHPLTGIGGLSGEYGGLDHLIPKC